jgi:hypothetical protein
MLTHAKKLEGFTIRAIDGDIGRVRDLYFDDEHWHVRYVVVDTGSWLKGRTVLLSTSVLCALETSAQAMSVGLTQEQVRGSPHVDTAKPVSRQHEEQLHQYYAWPYYWGGPLVGGGLGTPVAAGVAPTAEAIQEARAAEQAVRDEGEERAEAHLRSVADIRNYHIQASDGALGHVEDVLVEEGIWAVRYFVVDTRNWWPGRKVLVSPRWIDRISWLESSVWIDLTRDEIKAGPEFDPASPPASEFTDRLEAHYRRARKQRTDPAA